MCCTYNDNATTHVKSSLVSNRVALVIMTTMFACDAFHSKETHFHACKNMSNQILHCQGSPILLTKTSCVWGPSSWPAAER